MRGLQTARRRDWRARSGERIQPTLVRFQRARAYQVLPEWVARGFCAGVAVAVVAFVASVIGVVALDRAWLVAPPLALASLAALIALIRRAPLDQVARQIDARLGLAERVATALEIERRGLDGALDAVQHADALFKLRHFEPREAFPLRLSRRDGLSAVAALAILVGSLFLPHPGIEQASSPPTGETARVEAERLSALADNLADDEDLPAADRAALGQALLEAAQEIQRQADAPEQSIAALSETEQALASQENPRAADSELALARLADALAGTDVGREAAQLLDRRDFTGAADELRRLGDAASRLSPDDRMALAEAMRRAATASSRLDSALSERLAAAANALDGDRNAEAMADVADEVRRAGQEVASQRARERALAALQDARRSIGSAASDEDGQTAATASDQRATGETVGQASSGDASEGANGAAPAPGAGAGSSEASQGSGTPGGSGSQPGTGSLRNRGESEANDFRSRQVTVPSDAFEQPRVLPGQQNVDGPDGQATVDYRDVLAQYEARATEAMASRYVPPALKDLVREYFSSLEAAQ